MPAIVIFGYKSLVGGDDLQLPSALTIAGRFLQGIPLCGSLLRFISNETHCGFQIFFGASSSSCPKSKVHCWLFFVWVLTTLIFGVASIALECRIWYWTNQGTPVQMEPRSSHIAKLLELKLWNGTLILFTIGLVGVMTLTTAVSYYTCHDFDSLWWLAIAGFLLLTQWAEIVILCLFLCQLSRLGHYQTTIEAYDHQLVQDMWVQRCATCYNFLSLATCYVFGGKHAHNHSNTFGDVAMALADFLESQDVLDIVLSDFMTGLLILQRLQRQRVYAARQRIRAILEEDHISSASGMGMATRNNATNGSISGIRQRMSAGRLADDEEGLSNRSSSEDLLLQGRDQELYMLKHPSARLSLSDMPLLDEAARYAKHALAIYTWVLYLYEHPMTGPMRLALHGKFCCEADSSDRDFVVMNSPRRHGNGLGSRVGRIEGDNFFQTHKKAILSTANITEDDLVFVQLKSSFTDNPYCIILDHSWKTVVLSVRGTFSLEDCVTDTLISPVSLENLGKECGFDATNQYCHSGVVACARNVYRDLNHHTILDQLLLGDNALYPDYTLRLVGHSLGASTSVLLSYMLRPKFPTLRCVAYSPAGCTFTWEMATRCNEWTTACVLDADIVPRLSVDSIRELRDEVLDIVGRIKVPKYEVAQRLVRPRRCLRLVPCVDTADVDPAGQEEFLRRGLREILYDPDTAPQFEYHQQVARFHSIQSERKSQRFEARLYPPGRILLIAKTGELKSCFGDIAKCLTCCTTSYGSSYGPVWVNNDELNEIVVSPTMGTDHFPTRMRTVLERVADEFSSSGKYL